MIESSRIPLKKQHSLNLFQEQHNCWQFRPLSCTRVAWASGSIQQVAMLHSWMPPPSSSCRSIVGPVAHCCNCQKKLNTPDFSGVIDLVFIMGLYPTNVFSPAASINAHEKVYKTSETIYMCILPHDTYFRCRLCTRIKHPYPFQKTKILHMKYFLPSRFYQPVFVLPRIQNVAIVAVENESTPPSSVCLLGRVEKKRQSQGLQNANVYWQVRHDCWITRFIACLLWQHGAPSLGLKKGNPSNKFIGTVDWQSRVGHILYATMMHSLFFSGGDLLTSRSLLMRWRLSPSITWNGQNTKAIQGITAARSTY